MKGFAWLLRLPVKGFVWLLNLIDKPFSGVGPDTRNLLGKSAIFVLLTSALLLVVSAVLRLWPS